MWTNQTEMTLAEVAGQAKGNEEQKRQFLNCRKNIEVDWSSRYRNRSSEERGL